MFVMDEFLCPMRLVGEEPAHPKNFLPEDRMVTTWPLRGVERPEHMTLVHALWMKGTTTDVYLSHSRASACCAVSASGVRSWHSRTASRKQQTGRRPPAQGHCAAAPLQRAGRWGKRPRRNKGTLPTRRCKTQCEARAGW